MTPSAFGRFRDDVRRVIIDKRGPAGIDQAFVDRFVGERMRHDFSAGAHAGFVADWVRRHIETRADLAIAQAHERGKRVNPTEVSL